MTTEEFRTKAMHATQSALREAGENTHLAECFGELPTITDGTHIVGVVMLVDILESDFDLIGTTIAKEVINKGAPDHALCMAIRLGDNQRFDVIWNDGAP